WRLQWAVPPRSFWRVIGWFLLGSLLELTLTSNLTWFGGACVVGLRSLFARAVEDAPARAFACLIGALWFVTALWLPFDWSRYYLPLATQMVSVHALGTAVLARSLSWAERDAGYPIDSLPGGLAVGVAALVAVALSWALYAVVTPPLLPN
ncbi:MAG TPA: hypothetical protein VHZ95_13290, partial [Polyangiales bacterium]|nr:hypothetical protein [Polyangiales bacterium]